MALSEQYITDLKKQKETSHAEMLNLIREKETINLRLDKVKKTHAALSSLLLIAENN